MWIAAIDPSKRRTGYCLIQIHPWAVKSGSLPRFQGEDVEIYAEAFISLARFLKHTIPKQDIDRRFLIERPMYQIATQKVTDHTGTYNRPAGNPKDQCILHGIAASFTAALALAKFEPHESGMITPAAWRKAFFGKGFKPRKDKHGKQLWKVECVEWLEREGISVANHDEAEATAMAMVLASWVRRFA